MPDRFKFTERELWRIQKGMMVTTRATSCNHYRDDIEMQRYNWHVCRNAVRVLRTGVPTGQVPASTLKRIYESAHAGFKCSRTLGRDEAVARTSAVTHAQTQLEFAIKVLEHGMPRFGGRCDD